MKITPKYLSGGYLDFFTQYDSSLSKISSPSTERSAKQSLSKSSSDNSDKGTLTEKDFFNMIEKIDALPNERLLILSLLAETFSTENLIGKDANDIKLLYLSNLNSIMAAKDNKEMFTNAETTVRTNDALGEVAISKNGDLVVLNSKGDLGYISLDDYYDNPSAYKVLSNLDLIYLRRNSTSFAGDLQSFNILQNAMSYAQFALMLDLFKISIDTTESKHQGYINTSAKNGLEVLSKLSKQGALEASGSMTIAGLYKYNLITKSEAQQIKSLINVIKTTLPKNVKTWASIKTGIKNPDLALETLLIEYYGAGAGSTYDFDIDYKGTELKLQNESSGKSNDPLKDLKLNTPALFISGVGQKENFVINPGTSYSNVVTSIMQPLTDSESKPLGVMCTLKEVSDGEWQGSLDWNKATMGGRPINIPFFNLILIEDGKAYSIDYPINPDGTPDLRPTIKENRDKAIKDLNSLGIDINDAEQVKNNISIINAIMEKYELPAMFNDSGEMITDNWGRFAVMNGIADNKVLGIDPIDREIPILNEITDESLLEQRDIILSEKLKYKFKTEYGNWFSNDTIYEGTIWIPVNNDYFNALVGSGTKITPDLMKIIYDKQETRSILDNYVKTPPL